MNGSIRPVSETLVRNTNPPALAGGCSDIASIALTVSS
jgi:hypothetical protein